MVGAHKAQEMTSDDIHKALQEDLYPPGKWVYLKEFRAGAGLGPFYERYLDAFCMEPFPSTPMRRVAIEIKVTRGDFAQERRKPMKRDAAMHISNQFYFAAPRYLLKEEDIYPECGLIEVSEDGCADITIKAPWRDNLPTWPFVASLARRIEELQKQIEGQKAMTAVHKLTEYKARLVAWKQANEAKVLGAEREAEPKPEDYGITSASSKFMAKSIREEVLGK
jgi:hypothetical protein